MTPTLNRHTRRFRPEFETLLLSNDLRATNTQISSITLRSQEHSISTAPVDLENMRANTVGSVFVGGFAACRVVAVSESNFPDIIRAIAQSNARLCDLRKTRRLGTTIPYWLTRAGSSTPFEITSPALGVKYTHRFNRDEFLRQQRAFHDLGHRCALELEGQIRAYADDASTYYRLVLEVWKLDGDFGLRVRFMPIADGTKRQTGQLAVCRTIMDVCRLNGVLELVEHQAQEFELRGADPRYRFHATAAEHRGAQRMNPAAFSVFGFVTLEEALGHMLPAVDAICCEIETSKLGLGGFPPEEYERQRATLNDFTTAWEYRIPGRYKHNFDIFEPGLPVAADDSLRLPVLYGEDTLGGPALQVDVVHASGGAFLEFQSTKGQKFLQQVADSVRVHLEFWEDLPHLRWDAKAAIPPKTQPGI